MEPIAITTIEQYVLELVRAGKPLHGEARDIYIEMCLRAMEEEG